MTNPTTSITSTSGKRLQPTSGPLPGRKPDGSQYDEIYLKDYFTKLLLARLYGQSTPRVQIPGLVGVIDSFDSDYNLEETPFETIKATALSISLDPDGERTQLEADLVNTISDELVLSTVCLDPTLAFEKFIREFMAKTIGDDLRVPNTANIDNSGGYDVHIRPVSTHNEQVLLSNLKQRGTESDTILKRAFREVVKEKLNLIFASVKFSE